MTLKGKKLKINTEEKHINRHIANSVAMSVICACGLNKGNLGKKFTESHRKKISKRLKGKNNGMWKGDNVGYSSLHEWIKNHKPKKSYCEICKIKKSYDLANISGKYKRDIDDYLWLCRSCHMRFDIITGQRSVKKQRKSMVLHDEECLCDLCNWEKVRDKHEKTIRS